LPRLAATRSTQATRGSSGQAAPSPRATINQSLALTASVLGWVNQSCPLDAVTLPRALAATRTAMDLLGTLPGPGGRYETPLQKAIFRLSDTLGALAAGQCSFAAEYLQESDDYQRQVLGEQ